MIREIATKKSSTGARGFLMVVGICLMVILLSMLVGYIQSSFGINHLEYGIYALLFALGIILIKVYITQYRYSFINDELIIEKLIGNRAVSVITLRIWEIECFEDCHDIDKALMQECSVRKLRADKKNTWAVIYNSDDKPQAILFNPSQEFIDGLGKALRHKEQSKTRQPDI